MLQKLYPNGKNKAVVLTYDDGITQDLKFISLLKKYNLTATFNLNFGLSKNEFSWKHESGLLIKRLSTNIIKDLYKDYEVASHTLTHPYLNNLTKDELMYELYEDKQNLEKLFSREIKGFAIPFDFFSPLIESCVKEAGFKYCRISEESESLDIPDDIYKWKTSIFHLNPKFQTLVNEFFTTNKELALLQIVGHTYDLDTNNMWDSMEQFFISISQDSNVISLTMIDLIEYINAMKNAVINSKEIINKSSISLYFKIENKTVEVKPNSTYVI